MQRRDLLKIVAGGAVGLSMRGWKARADDYCPDALSTGGAGWGVVPAEADFQTATDPITGWTVPSHGGARAYKVLEIFLVGGCSVWDTFAAHLDAYGSFSAEHNAAGCGVLGGGDPRITFKPGWKLAPSLRPLSMPLPYPGRTGGVSTQLFQHMRILPVSHNVPAHDQAAALSMHGLGPSSTRMTATAAAIARRFGTADKPRGWVIHSHFEGFGQQHAGATGMLPGSTRPIVVNLEGGGDLAARLRRDHFTGQALNASAHDTLLNAYRAQYRTAAAPPTCANPLRSTGLSAYENAADALPQGGPLAGLFSGVTVATGLSSGAAPFCRPMVGGDFGLPLTDGPTVALDVAVNLLKTDNTDPLNPTDNVRHVLMFDGGIGRHNLLAYDAHNDLSNDVDNNLHATMARLAFHIQNQNLDLRNTIVVINTEFGRTAVPELAGPRGGRGHNPFASWSVVIGGPTIGPYVWGDFTHTSSGGSPTDGGVARGFLNGAGSSPSELNVLTPPDVRTAALAAAGVNALWRPELFEVAELGREATRPTGLSVDPVNLAIMNLKSAVFRAGAV